MSVSRRSVCQCDRCREREITPESLLQDLQSWAADYKDVVIGYPRLEAIVEAIPEVLGRATAEVARLKDYVRGLQRMATVEEVQTMRADRDEWRSRYELLLAKIRGLVN